MKSLNKTAVFGVVAALGLGHVGCAAQGAPARPAAVAADAHGFFGEHAARGRGAPQGWAPGMQGWPPGMQGWVPGMQGWPPGVQGWPPGMQGWPPGVQGWVVPWLAPAPQGQKRVPAPAPGAPAAVAFATSRLGTPYCWGGNGPSCYDCSGLTTASWKTGGKAIPRTSEAQGALPEVPFDRMVPGDIVWRPGHVGLYVGNGKVIHAPRTGDVVRYTEASKFVKAVRP